MEREREGRGREEGKHMRMGEKETKRECSNDHAKREKRRNNPLDGSRYSNQNDIGLPKRDTVSSVRHGYGRSL